MLRSDERTLSKNNRRPRLILRRVCRLSGGESGRGKIPRPTGSSFKESIICAFSLEVCPSACEENGESTKKTKMQMIVCSGGKNVGRVPHGAIPGRHIRALISAHQSW